MAVITFFPMLVNALAGLAAAGAIERDLARAIALLKTLATEADRERVAVYMDGLSQMRSEWGVRSKGAAAVRGAGKGREPRTPLRSKPLPGSSRPSAPRSSRIRPISWALIHGKFSTPTGNPTSQCCSRDSHPKSAH